jgi:hypothetical protein
MKALKVTTLFFLVTLVAIFTYANTRTISPGAKLKPVVVSAFVIDGNLSDETAISIQDQVSAYVGVTACKINAEGKIGSVIYHSDMISESSIKSQIEDASQLNLSVKHFEASGGGCPVHKIGGAISSFISRLDLRIKQP